MLHPTLWQKCGDNLDLLLCIAKWCPRRQLIAFSRTCKYFASKSQTITIETLCEEQHTRDISVSRNTLWKLAQEYQYPDKPYLNFLGDEMNYLIAQRNKFIIQITDCIDRDICEYDPMMIDYIKSVPYDISHVNLKDCVHKFRITNQFCLFTYTERRIKYHNSYDTQQAAINEIHKIQKVPFVDHKRKYIIIDLSQVNIYIWGIKKNISDNVNGKLYHCLIVQETYKNDTVDKYWPYSCKNVAYVLASH